MVGGGGRGHIVPALTLTNYNFKTARRIITKSRDFSWNLSEKIFLCQWHVSDDWRFHGNRLLRRCFDYFLSFFSLFFSFFPFVCKKRIILHFFVLVLVVRLLEQIHIFFDVVIVNCMTACSGFKMAAQNSKWLLCDVILTSWYVIIDTS